MTNGNKTALPAWRNVLRNATESNAKAAIQEHIAHYINQYKDRIEFVCEELAKARQASKKNQTKHIIPKGSRRDRCPLSSTLGPGEARSIIERAHKTIESEMLAAIPWHEIKPVAKRQYSEWSPCHLLLRFIRMRMASKRCSKRLVKHINMQWERATRFTIAATRSHYARRQTFAPRQGPIDQLCYSNPSTWATNLGLDIATSTHGFLRFTTTTKAAFK